MRLSSSGNGGVPPIFLDGFCAGKSYELKWMIYRVPIFWETPNDFPINISTEEGDIQSQCLMVTGYITRKSMQHGTFVKFNKNLALQQGLRLFLHPKLLKNAGCAFQEFGIWFITRIQPSITRFYGGQHPVLPFKFTPKIAGIDGSQK